MSTLDALLAGLDDSQREAVTSDAQPLCVIAPAGSGKTRVLTRRVARRVADGSALAEHVLAVTFTRKAAAELAARLARLGCGSSVRAGTFHAIALAELARWHADRALRMPKIIDSPAHLLRDRPGRDAWAPPEAVDTLAAEINWAQARLVSPAEYPRAAAEHGRRTRFAPERVAELYAGYVSAKERRGVLDLDDVLARCGDLLESDDTFAGSLRWRARHLFVDELQDINQAQWRLLRSWLGDRQDLFVVGDPDQAVYGWNGSDPTLLPRLPDLLRGTSVLRLRFNHRSSPQVLAVATAVLEAAHGTDPAQPTDPAPAVKHPLATMPEGPLPAARGFPDQRSEAAAVARWLRLAHASGIGWSQMAVLARTNARLGTLARVIGGAGIPLRQPEGGDGVELATFHRAKGLEWRAVALGGLDEASLEGEEGRLVYVALTRCERDLWCSWAGAPSDAALAVAHAVTDLEASAGLERDSAKDHAKIGLARLRASLGEP